MPRAEIGVGVEGLYRRNVSLADMPGEFLHCNAATAGPRLGAGEALRLLPMALLLCGFGFPLLAGRTAGYMPGHGGCR